MRDGGDDRAHLSLEVGTVEHFQSLGALDQFGHDAFGNIADQHRHADRHTTLAGRTVGRADQSVDRLVDVGIGHHDHMVFSAP